MFCTGCSALSLAFSVCHLQKQLGSMDSDPVLPVLLKKMSCSSPEILVEEAGPCAYHTQTAPWHSTAGMTDR